MNNFYIDEPLKVEPEKKKLPKPMTGTWWKYGLALAALQLGLWLLLGYRLNPELDLVFVFSMGSAVYGMFILMSFLPFIFARIGLTRLMWFTLTGLLLGVAAYYLLALFEPTRRFNLLPFMAYLQLSFAGLSLGVVWELGRYVFRKVRER